MGVAEKLKQLPPLPTILKVSTMGCAAFLAVMGGVFMFFSVFNLSISDAFIGFYLLCGGALMILAELQFGWFLAKVNIFSTYAGRGIFYIFVGSLVFAVFEFDSILDVLLMIAGFIVLAIGIVTVLFHFFADKLNAMIGGGSNSSAAGGGSSYDIPYSDPSDPQAGSSELQDPNFDPNVYSQDYTASSGYGSYGGGPALSFQAESAPAPPATGDLQTPNYEDVA
eukprot:CAMPEP_0114618292 /NCGR_PEP_ID=MMETSP0168-20121206/7629_1 /TAXON_ID=95228 ORGANISM="Vannella sp., Strain DIVA3 517/6/12" /NCGR_SAMPLE_ID=MMETSP0168 /ASSEMBLY_ACC=CAM_ASM_000044 /LENGTH=223 /DNA_ID=CAMNT_0001829437 /DNA_START=21 /DNA_END=692 /DNA_ORIENTATION=+